MFEAPAFGTVHLMDWMSSPSGQVRGLRGEVTIVSDEDGVGFKARGAGSANWMAIVRGETETWYLFGCQIRGFTEHGPGSPMLVDTYLVP